jgi:hypothetical protein
MTFGDIVIEPTDDIDTWPLLMGMGGSSITGAGGKAASGTVLVDCLMSSSSSPSLDISLSASPAASATDCLTSRIQSLRSDMGGQSPLALPPR